MIVDPFISGIVWKISDQSKYKKQIQCIESEKNKIYKELFLAPDKREEFLKNKNVILYGAGDYGKRAYINLMECGVNILAVVDSDVRKHGKIFGNYIIQSSNDIKSFYISDQTYVVIANHHSLVEMVKDLLAQKIDRLLLIT